MRKTTAILALMCCTAAYALDFEGNTLPVQSCSVAASGLDAIYVAPTTAGLTLVYTPVGAAADVRCYRFDNAGAAYAEPLTATVAGGTVRLAAVQGDMGYVFEDGTTRRCYWLVDYTLHALDLRALAFADDQGCGEAVLTLDGSADAIPYYTPTGRRMLLDRELTLSYLTEAFDEDSFAYTPTATTQSYEGIAGLFTAYNANATTTFELSGDRFLRAWGAEQSIASPLFTPVAVDARTRATQAEREVDNEQSTEVANGLGGSAPVEVTFEAVTTEAAIFTEWQISRSPGFETTEDSYNQLSFTYTFTEQGNWYVRFVANNAEGTCEFVGDTYQVFIGESKLLIPNAFSPNASPGINDEWKVSYRSITDFECHIFSRSGQLLFSTTDPAKGWDGKFKGKYVPAGVYFYVIKARGADGVKYEKGGDINIITAKGGSNTLSPNE